MSTPRTHRIVRGDRSADFPRSILRSESSPDGELLGLTLDTEEGPLPLNPSDIVIDVELDEVIWNGGEQLPPLSPFRGQTWEAVEDVDGNLERIEVRRQTVWAPRNLPRPRDPDAPPSIA